MKKRSKKRRTKKRYRFETAAPLILGRRTTQTRSVEIPEHWLTAATSAVAITVLLLWLFLSPRFRISEAQVIGAGRLSQAEIYEASGLDGRHVLWARGGPAEENILERLPSISWARVACAPAANCTIAVVERLPMLSWQTGEQLLWVDAAGGFTPALEPLEGGWEIHGPLPLDEEGRVERDVLVGVAELEELGVIPQSLDYQEGRGLVIADGAGWRVILGEGSGMERRLRAYAAIREHLLEEGVQPRFVDVRFPEAPYYSEENEW